MTLRILAIAGHATVQDLGWQARRSVGLPPSGAVDPGALRLGNALVGNDDGAAGIELALGAAVMTPSRPVHVAITGAAGECRIDDRPLPAVTTIGLLPGEQLRIAPGGQSRFCYLAVEGGIDVPPLLGSRSTYVPTGLGGWHGRRLLPDDVLPLGTPGSSPPPGTTAPLGQADPAAPIRIAPASHTHLFPADAFGALVSASYRLLPMSDRMGSRLDGPAIRVRERATLPSEGTCVGAVQIPDDGKPIVLLPDGPTVGGYPKLGTVIGADLARFGQTPLGGQIRFTWVSTAEAEHASRAAARAFTAVLAALRRGDSRG